MFIPDRLDRRPLRFSAAAFFPLVFLLSISLACGAPRICTQMQDLDATQTPLSSSASAQSIRGYHSSRIALLRQCLWAPGKILKVLFLDGTPAIQAKVRRYALQWNQYSGVKFQFVSEGPAEIRVTFVGDVAQSYIGTACLDSKIIGATMWLGLLNNDPADDEYSRVVLHEFGHALGCIHEHQNPTAGILWNKEAVYAAYAKAPIFWSAAQVDLNIFQLYSSTTTQFSSFDATSIMLYAIPAEFTLNGFSVEWNRVLSDTDKAFIAGIYPQIPPSNLSAPSGATVEIGIK